MGRLAWTAPPSVPAGRGRSIAPPHGARCRCRSGGSRRSRPRACWWSLISSFTNAGTITRPSPCEPITSGATRAPRLGHGRPIASTTDDQNRAGSESPSSTWSQATRMACRDAHDASSVDLPEPAGALTRTSGTWRSMPPSSIDVEAGSFDEARRWCRRTQSGRRDSELVVQRHLVRTLTPRSHPGEKTDGVRRHHPAR